MEKKKVRATRTNGRKDSNGVFKEKLRFYMRNFI